MRKGQPILLVLAIVATGALAYGAYRIVGYLGIAILGVLMAFIAVQVDIDKSGAIGDSQAASLYANQASARERMSRSEKAAFHAEMDAYTRPLFVIKVLGVVLIVGGTAAFWFL